MEKKKVTSTDIKKALSNSYNNDYFITECKTCPTYFPDPQGLLKFDGLAITKSYTKPCIKGYEIKISRGDFLQDNKWHLYLQYCNEFYFVVPSGLITKDEIPENVGLIYYNPDTEKLLTKKKALYREIEKPVGVYEYIIFSRLEQDRVPFYENRAEYALDYIRDKREKRRIGKDFGSKMAEDFKKAQDKLEELKYSEDDLKFAKDVEKILEKHKIGYRWRGHEDNLLQQLDEALCSAYPRELDRVEGRLQGVLDELTIIREKYKKEGVKIVGSGEKQQ